MTDTFAYFTFPAGDVEPDPDNPGNLMVRLNRERVEMMVTLFHAALGGVSSMELRPKGSGSRDA